MNTKNETLARSNDRLIAGVVGGFAEYYHVEPLIMRLAAVFLAVATGLVPAVVTYGAALALMPAPKPVGSGELAVSASKVTD